MTTESDCVPQPTTRSLSEALSQWPTPACLVDGEGRVAAGSAGLAELTGTALDDLKGLDPQLLIQGIGDGHAATWMAEIVDGDGDRIDLLVVEAGEGHLSASGRTVLSPGLSLDRLAAIGEVAPPLFHDLNNMLGSISGIAELAAMKLPDGDPMKQRLGRVVDTVIRASALGRQISLLVRTPPESPARVELIELVEEAMVLARSFLNRGITIETRWPEHPVATELHPSSLRHLVVEIVLAAGVVLQDQEGSITWTIAKGGREDTGRPTACLTVTAAPLRDSDNPADPADSTSLAFTPGFFRKIATISSLANSFGGHVDPVRLEAESGFSLTLTLPVCENTAL
ncbi:MAG: hypothetical protein R3F07_19930 [Opitutaceae bacterium]